MSALFDRFIEVEIYANSERIGILTTINSRALDIEFDVLKTNTPENNKGFVKVYGLNEDTVFLIKSSRPASLTLKAGYGSEPLINNIFIGDISTVSVEKVGADLVSTFELVTSLSSTRSLATSKSWGKGVSLTDVINYVSLMEGITIKQPTRYKPHIWKRGLTISGNLIEELKRIVVELGMLITIEDNILEIWTKGSEGTFPVVVLSEATGVIGIPEAIAKPEETRTVPNGEQNISENPNDLDVENKGLIKDGYKITSLLNSALVPNSRVSLTSEKVKATNSLLIIGEARHYGSNFGEEFYSEVTCYENGDSL